MKKLTALLLILMLTALCAPALAANTDGLGDTVARNAELAAFLDGSGNIYVSGLEKPVNATKAQSLVSIDPYRILFFAQGNASAGVPQGRLVALALDGFEERILTDDAYAACLDEENVYYISRSERTHLVQTSLDTGTSVVVFTAAEALDRIYDSSIGVVATLVDGAGAYITDPISGQFIPYVGDAARQIAQGDGFEVYLTDSNNLYARMDGALMPAQIDSNVRAWAILGRNVYYLSGSDAELALRQYNVDANLWTFILTPPANVEMQLTASENSLFMLSSDHTVYSVDVAGKRLVNYTTLPAPQSYALGGSRAITGYRIEAVSGQLNVYGVVEDSSAQPTFTFVDFSAAPLQEESDAVLLSAYSIDAESTVWDLLQPAPQYSTLRRGSRGDAVAAIQQPLHDAGYYNYYIDGIFGWRTERAVELLQDALGLRVNGVADADLQKRILSGSFPAYDPYGQLRFGDRGLRVAEMQQRLRDLGYLADDADSYFGDRTLAAVELFQRENGLRVDGVAGSETLRRLFSSSARTCSSYIELRRGDSGYRVRELNRRLKELYYLEGEAGSTFTAATAEALRLFQQEVGMRQTGIATEAVQRELFSRNAPEYSGYITLRRGDDNDRVLEMQRRLKQLGYYDNGLDGYFGKGTYQAVRAFQRQAGLKVTGVADPNTLKRLFASDAPAYQPPQKLTTPEIDFYGDSFDTDRDGVYLVPEDTESLTFFWTAKGVADYDIRLSGKGETITSLRGTTDEMVGVSTARLLKDVVYTFTVVAHPEDKVHNDDTDASLKFKIVTQPSVVESVTISPVEDTYTREDGVYLIPGDTISFRWTAYGDVGKYSYAVYGDDDPQTPIDQGEGSDLTKWGVPASQLNAEVTYSLTVFAYPKNGSEEDAVSDTVYFRPAVEPMPTPDPASEVPADPDAAAEGETPEEPTLPAAEVLPQDGDQPVPEDVPQDGDQPVPEDVPQDGDQPVPEDVPQDGDQTVPEDVPQGEAPGAAAGLPQVQASPSTGSIDMEIAQPDGGTAVESVVTIGEGDVDLSWAAEGDVVGYQVTITDSNGNVMTDNRLTNPSARVNSGNLIPGEVYTMTATAFFSSGESTSASLRFMRPAAEEPAEEPKAAPAETAPETEEPGAEAPSYEEPAVDEPAAAPEPLGTPSVQAYPNEGEVRMEVAHPDGSVTNEYVVAVGEGNVTLSWAAEGDVAEYQVNISDSSGNVIVDKRLTDTSATISAQSLTPGEVYTMTAYAYSASGADSSATLRFTRPAPASAGEAAPEETYEGNTYDEPAYDDPAYEQPAYDEPAYDEPAYDEPEYDVPEYDESEYDEPAYDEPAYDEPTYDEPAYDEPEYDEPDYDEPDYDEPDYDEPEYDEPAGGSGMGSIDANSDPDAIAALQKRLSAGGWLADGYAKGKLDDATVQAAIAFQSYCSEKGVNLTPIDPSNPVIGADTLNQLLNSSGN